MHPKFLVFLFALSCTPDDPKDDDSDARDDTSVDTDDSAADDSGDIIEEPSPCEVLELPAIAWQEAPDDDSLYALAADLTLETRAGDVVLSDLWSGCESMLFMNSLPRQAQGYADDPWDRDHRDFIERLPLNTHVFFLASDTNESDRTEALDEMQSEIEDALDRLDDDEAAFRRDRIHYVVGRDDRQDGWLGDSMSYPSWGMAIDRFQRLRYIGSYADYERYIDAVGWFAPNLSMAANEAVYYNFEAVREAGLDADGATVLPVFNGEQGSARVTVALPDASVLADADTLSVDMYMGCIGEGEFGTCPAWDYMAYLYMCDQPVSTENPHTDTACEVGDTLEGACTTPLGDERAGTFSCNADGTGYDDLVCGSCDTEISRWITTYHREGRWVYDISPMLPLFKAGGERTMQFSSSNGYELTASLRFSNQGKASVPTELHYMTLSEGSETFTVPSDAAKVEIATVISQHGQTCGEFCDADHIFTVNTDEANVYTRDFPTAGSAEGCMDQVAEGTIPNQYGTWWYGRAGWCPGKEVPTVTHDITDSVESGDNVLHYRVEGDAGNVRRRVWISISK
jgi:hypothetical protein